MKESGSNSFQFCAQGERSYICNIQTSKRRGLNLHLCQTTRVEQASAPAAVVVAILQY